MKDEFEKLNQLIKKWKLASQEAASDLYKEYKNTVIEQGQSLSMKKMLQSLGIDSSLLSYDSEEDDFLE